MTTSYARGALLSGAALAISLMGLAQLAHAQSQATPAATERDTIQEIVVTANKREEKLDKVGLTVTALSGEMLAERKLTSLDDISSAVPGLSYAHSATNTPILSLRGIGFNSAALGAYPAVSVYIDQAPLPFPVLASHSAYDLQRVEVLKGPQGTLFGENATGGAINFIAAKPTSTFEAGVDTSYGTFNQVENNFYLSGPISDNVRARISGTALNSDGWQISTTRPDDRNGAQSYIAVRGLVDWDASDRIRFSLNLNGWSDQSQPQAGQFIVLNAQSPAYVQPSELAAVFPAQNAQAADWSTGEFRPHSNRKLYQGALRTDIDLTNAITATLLTSGDHFTQNQTEDYDGLPILVTAFHDIGYIHSFNQEVRIANAATSSFRWIVGGNYENSTTWEDTPESFAQNSTANNPNAGFINSSEQYVHQSIRNIAGFGNVEYDLTSQLKANAGIRYTSSNNDAFLCTADLGDGKTANFFNFLGTIFGGGQPFAPVGPHDCVSINAQGFPNRTPTFLTLSEHNVPWRAGLAYNLNSNALLYANVSRGYKAGSFPLLPASDVHQYTPVAQESVLSYEAGVKTDLFDRRVHLNAAAFYYKYEGKQVLGRVVDRIFGLEDRLVNVPKSRVEGFDADITVKPAHGLTLTSSLTYLNSLIQQYVSYNAIGQFDNLAGNRLPFTPRWSYSVDADYRYELAHGGTPFGGFAITGRTGQDTSIGGSTLVVPPGPGTRVLPGLVFPFMTNPYTTLDVRLGYESPDGTWKVMAFGKNILNKYYWNNVSDQAETNIRFAAMPATYGVTLGVKFK
jgi:iron complex outermembrane receptor protein